MDSKYDAVFYEAFEEEERELRAVLPEGHGYLFTWKTIQESGHASPPARVVSVRTQSRLPFEWASLLDGIVTRSTGYDHVSEYLAAIAPRRLKAAYLPDYAARAVAEQAMMLWTVCLRNLKAQFDALGEFRRDGLTGREAQGKTIAVAGVGRIGSQIVDIACGLGMRPLGIDLVRRPELERKYRLEYVSLEEALPKADIVASALPLTETTRGMLGKNALSRVKKGAVFVNVGRGEVSPSEDLLELLDEGVLGGVGMDVYDCEKDLASVLRDGAGVSSLSGKGRSSVEAALKLMRHPKAALTPHNAFNTSESVERKSLHTAMNLERYFQSGEFLTPLPD